jgi:hypothetical protein
MGQTLGKNANFNMQFFDFFMYKKYFDRENIFHMPRKSEPRLCDPLFDLSIFIKFDKYSYFFKIN